MLTTSLRVRLVAETVGAAGLLTAVVGSGVMAQRLTDDVGLQLLVNAAATAAVLGVLICAFGPLSGAHLNPAVTLTLAVRRAHEWRAVAPYVVAQLVGAVLGTALANLMFELPALHLSHHERTGSGLWLGEVVATAGLVLIVFGSLRAGRLENVAFAVGGYIAAAYWFTSSTSFANPAVTLARTLTDSFAGIAPASAPVFVLMQLVGGAVGLALLTLLHPTPRATP